MQTRICFWIIVAIVLCTDTPAFAKSRSHLAADGPSNDVPLGKLRKHDRARIAGRVAEGKSDVVLVIAVETGKTAAVARSVVRLGGAVLYRADDVGYLRITVPVAAAEQVASLSDVQAVNVDGSFAYHTAESRNRDSRPNMSARTAAISPPGSATPAENPYLPVGDMGAPQFIAKNPTFDGRGVVIADIDSYADILLPELQSATSLDGRSVRKVIDVVSAIDPTLDKDDSAFLVRFAETVVIRSGSFDYDGVRYQAPLNGTYRIGRLPANRARLFGLKSDLIVLWDAKANSVLADTNQDRSFSDEQAMTDYSRRYDVGTIRADDPATLQRESIPFTVQIYPEAQAALIARMLGDHGTATASAAAGKALFGGAMNGASPGSQLVLIGGNTQTLSGGIEAFVLAVRHPKVDVVTAQYGVTWSMNDGSSVLSIICGRLVERYRKPIFVSAGNAGPGINRVNEYANDSRVMSVGSYVGRETWRGLYGINAPLAGYVANLSARGPREDGGFKPDFLAPSAGIYLNPGSSPGESLTDAYDLPPGYAAHGPGTSYAAPQAAGAAALLISAAKQSGISYDPDRLYWAMKSSARFLAEFGADAQGSGLIDVPAAWEALKRASKESAALGTIQARALVKTVLSTSLREPDEGSGIYEREGLVAGQTEKRTVALTRTAGSRAPVRYRLDWQGGDGTFSSPDAITLAFNIPTEVPVTVSPKTPGSHSAILRLIDSQGRIAHQIMNSVVASERFSEANAFKVTRQGEIPWLGFESIFIDVPVGVSALKIDLQIPQGNLLMNVYDPTHETYGNRPIRPGYSSALVFYQSGGSASRTLLNPEAGVWEIVLGNDNLRDKAIYAAAPSSAKFELTAVVFGVEVAPGSMSSLHDELGTRRAMDIKVGNRFAAFTGRVIDTPLGSRGSDTPVITRGARRVYDIEVLPGTRTLTARIAEPSDVQADLDLYLFDCTNGTCEVRGFGTEPGAFETVTYPWPDPGKWRVVIDPVKFAAESVTVHYEDIFTHPVFGTLRSNGAPFLRSSGQQWTESVRLSPSALPSQNRRLAAVLEVADETVALSPANKDFDLARPDRPGALRMDDRPLIALGSAILQIESNAVNVRARQNVVHDPGSNSD